MHVVDFLPARRCRKASSSQIESAQMEMIQKKWYLVCSYGISRWGWWCSFWKWRIAPGWSCSQMDWCEKFHNSIPSRFPTKREAITITQMGNIAMDNRMGITIPQFELGGMIQLSGRAKLHLDRDESWNVTWMLRKEYCLFVVMAEEYVSPLELREKSKEYSKFIDSTLHPELKSTVSRHSCVPGTSWQAYCHELRKGGGTLF